MRVIIVGDLGQVVAFLKKPTFAERQRPLTGLGSARALKNEGEIARRNATIREQADTLRHAFALVRYEPEATKLADAFLAALVGRSERTEAVLEKASEIILSRQTPHSGERK